MDAGARVDGAGWKSSGNRSCLVMRKGHLVGTGVQLGEGGQAESGLSYQGLARVRLWGQGDICRVIDAWVGASAVLPGLVQFAAGFEGTDPERRVDGAQQYGLLIESLGTQK